MDKLKTCTFDQIQENIIKLHEMFPGCITEVNGANGTIQLAINFDQLRQELSEHLVEGLQECYQLTWPGKQQAMISANTPILKTLRPSPEESVNFNLTQNLFIEGDNLEAMKLLQDAYLAKVKLIYIDPPYNTGKNFIYADNFCTSKKNYLLRSKQKDEKGNRLTDSTQLNGRFDSDWLTMMYPRLRLAHRLLSDTGILMISIDDNEIHNLRNICDEILGRRNFLGTLIWNKQHSQQQGIFKKYHEYVVVYAKNEQKQECIAGGEGIIEAGALKKISKANPASHFTFPAGIRFDAPDGTILTGTYGNAEQISVVRGRLIAKNRRTVEEVTLSAGWTQKKQMASFLSGQETYDSKGQKVIDFFFNAKGKIKYLKERSKITPSTLLPTYGMVSQQSKKLAELIGTEMFNTPKPVDMMKNFIDWFSDKDDIIMDFFAGSGTTGHAIMEQNATDGKNRRFILVQLPEKTDRKAVTQQTEFPTIADIAKERLRRAGDTIVKDDYHKNWNKDIGFRVMKIDTFNT